MRYIERCGTSRIGMADGDAINLVSVVGGVGVLNQIHCDFNTDASFNSIRLSLNAMERKEMQKRESFHAGVLLTAQRCEKEGINGHFRLKMLTGNGQMVVSYFNVLLQHFGPVVLHSQIIIHTILVHHSLLRNICEPL